MKIAYFNAMLDKGHDGVTRVVFTMINGALARGHQAMAVSATIPHKEDRMVDFHRVLSVPLPWQRIYRIAVPGYGTFAKKLKEFQPDIIHINSPCTLGFAAMHYARKFDVPVVATYHTHFPSYARYYHMLPLEEAMWTILRKFYNHLDRTFVPSRDIMTELAAHKFVNLEHLSNGVDLSLFSPSFRSEQWRADVGAGNKPVVLFVSRLVWEKDLADLAAMYTKLRESRDDFTMVVVGDGHAREDLKKLMPEAVFLGYQSGDALATAYASSDIFVFPSTTETFGLVTVEAMASGIVPVAAAVGGAASIIEDGKSGLLVPGHEPLMMATQVERLLNDPSFREKLAAGALAHAQDFGWETILDRLFSRYEDVIAKHVKKVARVRARKEKPVRKKVERNTKKKTG